MISVRAGARTSRAVAGFALAVVGACGGPQDNSFYGEPVVASAASGGSGGDGVGVSGHGGTGGTFIAGSAGTSSGGSGGDGGVAGGTGPGASGGSAGSVVSVGGVGGSGEGGRVTVAGGGGSAGDELAGAAGMTGGEGGAGGEAPSVDCSAHGATATGFDGHCYLYEATAVTWNDAVSACEDQGAHLVTISSEGRSVAQFLAENSFVWLLAGSAPSWLGATDGKGNHAKGDGTFFKWITPEPMTLDNWSSGQPNNARSSCQDGHACSCDSGACYEHCGFQWDTAGKQMDAVPGWNDRLCDHVLAYVCEWDEP